MIALGCDPQDPRFGFPELNDEDLYTKCVDEPNQLGDGAKGYHENLTAEEEAAYVLDYLIVFQQQEYSGIVLMQICSDGGKNFEIVAQEIQQNALGLDYPFPQPRKRAGKEGLCIKGGQHV
ncbi:hypothetical protein C8R45DRAFT_947114 [Mycena sanguinolenta]|nr:hypothetical protein C8R45DRAFT_947114 [Mycena sanguinolenta]